MKESLSEIKARRTALKERVLQILPNQTYSFVEFLSSTRYRYKIQKDKKGKEAENELTERQIKYDLKALEVAIRPRRIVFLKGGLQAKDDEEGTSFGRRKQRSHEIKERLGDALWDLLLGPQWRGASDSNISTSLLDASSPPISNALELRAQALRRRNQLYFAADAGSSTLAVITSLLQAERIPLEISVEPKKTGPENYRIVEPVLLTNSFPIAEAVAGSGKHRWSFIVEFIGGIMRPGRNCTTGELTSVWLHVCCAEGRIGTLDLAIVGVTGVTIGMDGVPIVACDDAEEATLKRKFLSMAGNGEPGSGIRVMVFHAAKLLFPEARCRFAVVTKSMVDLIVVNVGGNEQEREVVRSFVETITKLSVDVLVVSQPSIGKQSLKLQS
jgi:hypothetical protein